MRENAHRRPAVILQGTLSLFPPAGHRTGRSPGPLLQPPPPAVCSSPPAELDTEQEPASWQGYLRALRRG